MAFPPLECIIGLTVVVLVEVALEPLAKFKVVLIPRLCEFLHINMSFHSIFVERVLQDLVVIDEFVLVLGAPLDLGEVEGPRVNGVHHAAVDGARRALLNLREV